MNLIRVMLSVQKNPANEFIFNLFDLRNAAISLTLFFLFRSSLILCSENRSCSIVMALLIYLGLSTSSLVSLVVLSIDINL